MRSALQQAIYDVLQPALSVPVYDDVPQKTPLPYVVIGEDAIQSFYTDDSIGAEAAVEIHIWTSYAGRKQGKDIADSINAVLHEASLNVPGYSLAVALWDSTENLEEGDGVTREIIETYRVLLQE